ncbi:hypothetical protein OGM63_05740 [Plectonema radiosum NIES-515]|uniref:Uncharacterized protein n=1 Tax=Plectonema radiosum NIES-515 TaxID=2986073 RepID=A0ABT3AVB0_9CYAN|nr:hypothetical protein [Plectonema radiosum]MCV3213033.1 hypothetical protein [Plectonema radiosum NIES-515]
MESGKYITKSKRIRQLEKQVLELQKHIEALTIYLDQSHEMLLRSSPRLARSLERDWQEFRVQRGLDMSEEINPPPKSKQPKPMYKSLPLLARPDALLTRDPNGRLVASPRPDKV